MISKSQSEYAFYIAWPLVTFIYDLLIFGAVGGIVEGGIQRSGKPGHLKSGGQKGQTGPLVLICHMWALFPFSLGN